MLYHVDNQSLACNELLLLPQRYVFSSKSQRNVDSAISDIRCCCYHKGTYFQANHNHTQMEQKQLVVVVATTKVRIFKQITTVRYNEYKTARLLLLPQRYVFSSKSQHDDGAGAVMRCCCCYHKGTYFQANHNKKCNKLILYHVVVATTKVRIFKQITTGIGYVFDSPKLLLLPQRYVFSSKSQRSV